MAPRVPNVRVPNAKFLLRNGAGRSKYVPRPENSEFSITRITPQNALNLVKKFSDSELKTQYSPAEIEHLHDLASTALREEIIHITGRNSEGNMANFNEESINWLLQNDPLIYRLTESGSKDAQALNAFCNAKIEDLQYSNPELYESYRRNAWMKLNDGIRVNNVDTGEWTSNTGVLTDPPKDLPKTEVSKANMLNEGNTPTSLIRGKETPLKEGVVMEDIPIVPEAEKSAAAASPSPSPEAIGEAMRGAIKDRVGDTQLNKEDIPAFLTKEGEVKAAEDATKAETITGEAEKISSETAKKEGAPADKEEKLAESSQGLLSKIGGHIGRNWGKYLGGIGLGTIGWTIMDDLASDNSTLKSLFRGDYSTAISNTPSVTQPRNELATNEEYTPGRIPDHIPQDNLAPIKESTISKKVKNRPQQQKQQPQVIVAPENNATADYVRAAYNSYIPSDAGRAYQKAIYGDPLELERNRQQQKWRDFVMRSGQSPAELVQRGLMPYDALQYV